MTQLPSPSGPADRVVPADFYPGIEPIQGFQDTQPQSQAGTFGLPLLLNTFKRSWKLVIPLGVLLAVVVAALLIRQFTPEYQSYALIEIEDVAPYIAFQPGTAHRAGQQYVRTQIELMRSAVVLEEVLARPEVRRLKELENVKDPVKYLEDRLDVSNVGGSELYRIEFQAKDKRGARDVVKAIVTAYFDAQRKDEFDRTNAVIKLLEGEEEQRQAYVDELRQRVMELTEDVTGRTPYSAGITAPGNTKRVLSSIGGAMVDADVLREELKARIQAYEETATYVAPSSEEVRLLQMEVNAHPEIGTLRQEIERIRAQVEAYERTHLLDSRRRRQRTPDSSHAALQAELALREDQLSKAERRIADQLRNARTASRGNARREALADLKRQLATAEERYRVLSDRYEKEMGKLKEAGTTGVDLEFARAKLEQEERVLDMIAARKIALQTEQRAPARVRLLREPSIPRVPVEEIPTKLLTVGCLTALALPFGFAAAREMIVQRIGDTGQLRQELSMPVLAEVARQPAAAVGKHGRRLPKRVRQNMELVEECINVLRTTLVLANDLRSTGVLVVTSAASGEGKTTVAAQLAQSIARASGERTLLIDGDTRSPGVHDLFGLPGNPGLSEVLTDRHRLGESLHQVEGSRLFVLTAGKMTSNPHGHIRYDNVLQLLDGLRQEFPCIVIDTPPLLSAGESMVFARCADSVLLCCMRNVSRVRQVRIAVERLARAKANVCGAVMNGTPIRSYVDRYGGYPYGDAVPSG